MGNGAGLVLLMTKGCGSLTKDAGSLYRKESDDWFAYCDGNTDAERAAKVPMD